MELLPLHPILWSGLLVLCASQSVFEETSFLHPVKGNDSENVDILNQWIPTGGSQSRETEANSQDVCQLEKIHGDIYPESTSKEGHYVEEPEVNDNFHCLLYPTNTLNCSWSFHTLQKDTQLFVHISICDDERTVCSLNASPGERVGSSSLHLHKHGSHVILRFNLTLHHEWTVYTCAYDMDMIEVLSPPQNISASVKDGDLLVTWDLPHSRANSNPSCFEYQLDMGDQERPRNVTERLSYTEPNANPTCTYSVRMRARKKSDCQEATQWSDWSHAIRVEQSIYKLNTVVIILISLGIPMILLAVLLLVRYQRVSEVLFPPIPRPPPKYKCFLEKNDAFSVFHPAPSAEPEITEVREGEEHTEQKSGKVIIKAI